MKINKILVISMLLIAIFAVGAVSASDNATEVALIDEAQSIDNDVADDSIELSAEDNDDEVINAPEKEETLKIDDQEVELGDGETTTITKNITVYSDGKLVDTFNFTTAAGNNFTFMDIIDMINNSSGTNMSDFGAFGLMFDGFNFTAGSNKTVDFTVSGDVGQVKYYLRVVSNSTTYIFDYKVISSKTTDSTKITSKTLSVYADGVFLANVTFSTDGIDIAEMMKQFGNGQFDMSSISQYADKFKNMGSSGNSSESNRTFYFKIDGLVGTIKYDMLVISNATDFIFDYAIKYPKVKTALTASDLTTTTVNTAVDGKTGKYLTVTLKDAYGAVLANKEVQIGFNGVTTKVTTDKDGVAKLQINVAKAGTYTASICYLGDDYTDPSFKVVKVTVKKQSAKLTTSKKTYKKKAKTKKLTATFKSPKGKALKGKKITFTVKGKTYTAKTNAKGVATVKVKLTKKGKYTFTAKFAGDDTYNAVSKKAKLILK